MQIIESKGDIGVFTHPKPQVTAPKEFHFSTDDRLGPPSVADLFDKVVIESHITTNDFFLSRIFNLNLLLRFAAFSLLGIFFILG
jgi:hypothetical protein